MVADVIGVVASLLCLVLAVLMTMVSATYLWYLLSNRQRKNNTKQ